MSEQTTETYECCEPIKHNGKHYAVGDDIELTEEQAEQLMKTRTPCVKEKDIATKAAPTPDSTKSPLEGAGAADESGGTTDSPAAPTSAPTNVVPLKNDNPAPDQNDPKRNAEPTEGEARKAAIVKATESLDKDDAAHWTKDKRPDATVLSEKAGFKVSAKERDVVWGEMSKASD